MITWLNPVALVTLSAVAAPILVHLLLRHRALRTVVPTVRFVPRLQPRSIRLRRPSDPWLLVVRAGIVACAALALAAPLFVTEARRANWGKRIARAVIVDTPDGVLAPALGELVRAETAGSDPTRLEDTRELPVALRRAVNWLRRSPPARREIVVLSPFRLGAIRESDLMRVPDDIGLRFVRAPHQVPRDPLRGRVAGLDGSRPFQARLAQDSIAVEFGPPEHGALGGLVIHARPDEANAVERLRRVLGRVGVADADAARPIVVRFRGGGAFGSGQAESAETKAAALRLLDDPAIAAAPVAVSVSGDELRVDADMDAGSLDAAIVVRAALEARIDPGAAAAQEVALIPEATLRSWSRDAALPSGENARQSDRSDARWFWLAALLLLALEGALRRSEERTIAEVNADAA